MQLDKGYKGFSFSKEGPLDMRMDPDAHLSARKIVNTYSEKELATIFHEFGEDRHSRKIAKAIVDTRKKTPIETTTQLSQIVASVKGFIKGQRINPATLIFQALRIAVNNELDAVLKGLEDAIKFLSKGGRVGVISFHSLEDRIVKTVFKEASYRKKGDETPPFLKLLTKKPLIPLVAEMHFNPRARSAKLRFAEKV